MEKRSDHSPTEAIDVFSSIRQMAPRELVDFLDQVVLLFPEELRYRMKQVMDSLPADGDNMHKVLEVVRHQWKDIQSDHWVHIAVTGPSRTGKTGLIQAIRKKQAPEVESIFTVAETPGLDEYLGYGMAEALPAELEKADLILLVLDARYGISKLTRQVFGRLKNLDTTLLPVLNKIDLVDDIGETLKTAKESLKSSVFGTSIYRPDSIDKLLKAIVVSNPKTLYPLARSFPEFRRSLCNGMATQAAFACGLVGVLPSPVSDFLPVTAIQTSMILKIARAFGCRLSRERAKELIPMLAAGALVREGSHRLRRRFPDQSHLIGMAVSGVWTYSLGRLAVRYFERSTSFLQDEALSLRSADVGA